MLKIISSLTIFIRIEVGILKGFWRKKKKNGDRVKWLDAWNKWGNLGVLLGLHNLWRSETKIKEKWNEKFAVNNNV